MFIAFCLILDQTPALAICLEINDLPMDTQVLSAPPNIMFVLDDSGSMDWEFMIEGTSSGLYEGQYYIFDNAGDNSYSGSILSEEQRLEWMSQWTGYNKLYFSPHTTYTPWPNMSDADTTNPKSNPAKTNTLNLTDEFAYLEAEVVVDNEDAEFTYTGDWLNYGYYYYSYTAGDYNATWTASLDSGSYSVYVKYTTNNQRSDQVPYTVVDDDGSTTYYINQRIDNQTWVQLGTSEFDFSSGTATVYIDYTKSEGTSGYDRACADQVKFVSSTNGISIKNAHYFVIDDQDDDGERDAGEGIYLVNFVSGAREYYLFEDQDGDDRLDYQELTKMTVDTVPDSIRPKKYTEAGVFVEYISDAEDLQNFANWYSYYRRRALVAKGAVANSIINLSRVRVGFYTINSSSNRQTVLPINVDTNAIFADNKDSIYSESGNWSESGSPNEYEDSSRYTSSSGDSATWRPNITETGEYNVYAWWNCYNNRDQNAKYTVNYSSGSATYYMNQRLETGNTCGDWVQLGTGSFTFDAGTSGSVTVERHSGSNGSSTSADAIKFEAVDGAISVDQTEDLLDLLYQVGANGSTPLRKALQNVGRYFHQDDGSTGNLGSSPYDSAEDGGACQHAFAIVISDGGWNGDSPGVGNVDGSKGSPYSDSYSDTLADVAMYYYQNDLASGLSDEVTTTTCDSANHQHLVTYTISFGINGTLTPEQDDPCFLDPDTTRPTWPNPNSDSTKIDDLWHTAVNGRGLFFSAEDPRNWWIPLPI